MMSLLKRPSILLLLLLTVVSVSCKKNTPVAPPVPAPPAPPPPPIAVNPAPTISLIANTTAINAGQSVTLTWTATNANTVTIDPGIGAVTPATGGTRVVTPNVLTTYTATANGTGGTARSAGVTITVAAAAAPARPAPQPPAPQPQPNRTLEQTFTLTMVPVLFDYDKSTIRSGEESKLNNMASWLKQNPTVRFTIDGNADERGGQEYNIALGDDRAASVRKYLAGQGVAEARMSATSFGEERPLCREQTESCWQTNRRAGFTLVP
jgi:peptidoglycan-associated lipoprotein